MHALKLIFKFKYYYFFIVITSTINIYSIVYNYVVSEKSISH